MKRVLCVLLGLLFAQAAVAEANSDALFSESSAVFSMALAEYALELCATADAEATAEAFEARGFTVRRQTHYDKSADEISHTAAYTVGSQTVCANGEARTLIAVAIRGTMAAEWYANFDFAPSERDETTFAENFLFAASDVFLGIQEALGAEEHPLFLVCGYSRGAACANLLGLLLNAAYDPADVYAYTFATPATIRADAGVACENIFNIVNASDLVPMLPLAQWGYVRAGTDIVLRGDEDLAASIADAIASLWTLAPTISAYYTVRHDLRGPGESEDGLTVYEALLQFIPYLTGSLPDLLSEGEAQPDEARNLYDLIDEASDFHTLASLLSLLTSNGGKAGEAVLRQHMPDTYRACMAAQNLPK